MKLILLCLVATVFAKPKGPIKLADEAKDVAEKETEREAMAGHEQNTDTPCNDEQPEGDCVEWKNQRHCELYEGYMRNNCAKTCGYCAGTDTSCRDQNEQLDCGAMKQNYPCNHPEHEQFMSENCAKTCGKCADIPL